MKLTAQLFNKTILEITDEHLIHMFIDFFKYTTTENTHSSQAFGTGGCNGKPLAELLVFEKENDNYLLKITSQYNMHAFRVAISAFLQLLNTNIQSICSFVGPEVEYKGEDNLKLKKHPDGSTSIHTGQRQYGDLTTHKDFVASINTKVSHAKKLPHFDSVLKSEFITKRNIQIRSESFQFFRRSGLSEKQLGSMSFMDIVEYATAGSQGLFGYSGNRSLQILIEMGVLNKNKEFQIKFKEEYPDYFTQNPPKISFCTP